MAAKTRSLKQCIRMTIPAGGAKPAPPVGPALGQAGLNIMQFCKDFNAKTSIYKDEVPIPVIIHAYTDKSFDYYTKLPSASYFLKRAAGIEKGTSTTGHQTTGTVSLRQIYEIAKIKNQDDPRIRLESVCKCIIGQAKSMGIEVVAELESETAE